MTSDLLFLNLLLVHYCGVCVITVIDLCIWYMMFEDMDENTHMFWVAHVMGTSGSCARLKDCCLEDDQDLLCASFMLACIVSSLRSEDMQLATH